MYVYTLVIVYNFGKQTNRQFISHHSCKYIYIYLLLLVIAISWSNLGGVC